jgi:nucleotide-binding universal stress UspA family protein
LRNNDKNFLVIKRPLNFSNPRFVVCLDGSSSAIGALRMAKLFGDKYNAELHLIYVFDSALHKEVFGRLKESVINREGFSFNSKEQERIHDEFIDKGLARVGNMILEKAEREVFSEALSPPPDSMVARPGHSAVSQGLPIADAWGLVGDDRTIPRIKKVLEGHIYKKICDYASEVNADLIFVGRTGRHFVEGMDIGSVTENVMRFSPCSVFVASSEKHKGWEL